MPTKNKKTRTARQVNTPKKSYITHPKLIIFLLILLLIPAVSLTYNKYKDWDNAQLIKGLSKDFPILVQEVEQATGLNLDIKTDCSLTQEKFGGGVRTCELSVFAEANEPELDKAFNVMLNSNNFPTYELFENGEGYKTTYRGKNSCNFRTKDRIYSTCITAVREANTNLALEAFSEIN